MKYYILEGFRILPPYLKFTAEDDTERTYNIEISFDDFCNYFNQDIDFENIKISEIEQELNDAAQDIVDAFERGHTDYDCRIYSQKVIAYQFHKKSGGSSKIFKDWIEKNYSSAQKFLVKEKDYSHYTPIYG